MTGLVFIPSYSFYIQPVKVGPVGSLPWALLSAHAWGHCHFNKAISGFTKASGAHRVDLYILRLLNIFKLVFCSFCSSMKTLKSLSAYR